MDPTSNPFELLSDEGQKKLAKAQQPAAKTAEKKAAPAGKATTAAPSALASKPKGKPEAPVKQGKYFLLAYQIIFNGRFLSIVLPPLIALMHVYP